MEGLIYLAGLALLAALVMGPVAFFMLFALRRRIAELERKLALRPAVQTASAATGVGEAGTVLRSPSSEVADDPVETADEPEQQADPSSKEEVNDNTVIDEPGEPQREGAIPPPLPPTDEATPTPESTAKGLDTESKVGGKLTIWIGGLALAFGGLFLVRYAIENALLGPGARIVLGLAFGASVALAGEYLRRRQAAFALPGFEKANIPATLTAVGIFSMFAAVYAAYALYSLIGPTFAFLALALLALASLGLSLVHGPGLAAIGLLASYLSPFLIDADTSSITVLAIYVLAVSAAAITVARSRAWLWLAVSVVIAMTLFGLAFSLGAGRDQFIVTDLYLLGAFALGLVIFVLSFENQSVPTGEEGEEPERSVQFRPDWIATVALSVLVLPIIPSFIWTKGQALEVFELAILVAVPLVLVQRYPALRFFLIVPFIAASLRYLTLGLPALEVPAELLQGPSLYAAELAGSIQVFAAIGFFAAAAIVAAGFVLIGRSPARAMIAALTAALTLALLLVAYFRIEQFANSSMFALFGLVLAVVLYLLATRIHPKSSDGSPDYAGTVASYLIGGLVALTFAVSVALQGPAMTVALGLIPAAAAFIYTRFPLTALRVFALFSIAPYGLRLLWEPLIDPEALATSPPFFNDLLWGYGLPALGLIWAAWQISRVKVDLCAEVLQAPAIALSVATIALLCLHAIDPEFHFSTPSQQVAAIATSVLIGGGFSIGLTRVSVRSQFRIPRLAADFFSLLGILFGALGLFLLGNPLLEGWPPVGVNVGDGFVFNLLNFAYLLPALLFGAITVLGRETKAPWLILACAIYASISGFLWVNLTIRHIFSPGYLRVSPVEQGELYVYSIVWLLIGLIVLTLGIGLRNFILRASSGVIFVLVTLKVFLIDLSGLDGILRPISFIGLGLVLLLIGFVYQRALSRMQVKPEQPDPPI